jgi:DNA-binding NarL/FixJ family response regulator
MTVSEIAAHPADALTCPARDAGRAAGRLAVAVIGGDDVLTARVTAALRREGVAADVRAPGPQPGPAGPERPPEVVVLAVPAGREPAPLVQAVRRRLAAARVVVALAPGASARAAGDAAGAAPDGVVADADLDVVLGLVVRCARNGYIATPACARGAGGAPAFSRRERQIVRLVVQGLTNDEIAHRLFLAKSTVAGHLTAIFRRLGVRSRRELVACVLSGDPALRRVALAVALPGEEAPELEASA